MTIQPWLQSAPPPPPSCGRFTTRQEQILDGLQYRILHDGFRGLRLSSVTKELGTSFATLYQIASSRDELVAVVIERWYQRAVASHLEKLQHTDDPIEALRIWTDAGIVGAAETSSAFWRDARAHPAIRLIIEVHSRYYVEVLSQILGWGIATGVFRNVDTVLLALVWRTALTQLADNDVMFRVRGSTIGELSRNWVELVMRGIIRE